MNKGKVYLIGSGPGDPGLLTCRAKQLLGDVDVVCYDKLVSAAILSVVPKHVQLHQVGYRGYKGAHINYGMHPDVMEYALAGKRVARLKAGDPCIFGRTTEECRELIDNEIPYEIVPGITAALGAASYSGFPLTSAGIASSVTFVSGHHHSKTIASWGELGRAGGTLVLYMGAKKLPEHAAYLMANGRSPDTPIAVISSATSADHRCTIATLATVADKLAQLDQGAPTLVVVGEVVAQANELGWRSSLPLLGERFLLCGQYADTQALRENGAEVIAIDSLPTMSLLDREDLEYIAGQPALAFSDQSSLELWWNALLDNDCDIRSFTMPMGSDNALVRKALREKGLRADVADPEALILTLDEEKSFASDSRYYLVGQRKSAPQPFTVPECKWLLAEDIAVAESLIEHHPDALTHAQLVPLSNEVRQWAQESGYLTSEQEVPSFIDLPDETASAASELKVAKPAKLRVVNGAGGLV
jgi:uroporphyrinogen III methyltransferase/synthase